MQVNKLQLFPVYTRNDGNSNRFNASPIRQWRKQYQSPLSTQRTSAVGMPMDLPGGSIITESSPNLLCSTCKGSQALTATINHVSPCTSCQPITNKTQFKDTNYTDSSSYLQSRCSTYGQRLSTTRDSSINYFLDDGMVMNPSDSASGAQVRESAYCFNTKCKQTISTFADSASGAQVRESAYCFNTKCKQTIYKPNNIQYAQQGGVSSGSRIARLKYNTLNNNGAAFNSAAGAVNINSGRYQTEPSPSYYTKYKPQPIVTPRKSKSSPYCAKDCPT